MSLLKKNSVSYIQARDPSILGWNEAKRLPKKKNLEEEFCETSAIQNLPEEKDDNHIKVYLRIKNDISFYDLYKVENNVLSCKYGDTTQIASKKYSFSRIFPPCVSQIEIFNDVIKPRMLSFINGKNCTLMTYGASGSGKTFTIVGTQDEPGIIPRALEYLFRTSEVYLHSTPKIKLLANRNVVALQPFQQKAEEKRCKHLLDKAFPNSERIQHVNTYSEMRGRLSNEPIAMLEALTNVSLEIFISFAEIYNDKIYDLLGGSRQNLKLGGHDKDFYIRDLTEVYVTSGSDAYQLLQVGRQNLSYAATALNPNSSRSHFIFTIKLVQFVKDRVEDAVVSSFSFCDLAGAERLNKTGNMGDRLKESNNINVSLSVLGRCIQAVRNGQNHVDQLKPPFRESKLTKLFQKALMGLEDISMMVNINPSQEMVKETHHVLNFSAVAMEIVCEEPVVKIPKETEMGMKEEIDNLRSLLADKCEIIDILTHTVNDKNEEIDRLILAGEELSNERIRILEGLDEVTGMQKKMYEGRIAKLMKQLSELEHINRDLRNREPVISVSSEDESDESTQTPPYYEKLHNIIDDLKKNIEEKDKIMKKQAEENKRLLQENRELRLQLERQSRDILQLNDERKRLMNENLTKREIVKDQNETISELLSLSSRLSRQLENDTDSGQSTPSLASSTESLNETLEELKH